MKYYFFLFAILFFLITKANCQSNYYWKKNYQHNNKSTGINDVIKVKNNNYLICGSTEADSFSSYGYKLLLNSNCNIINDNIVSDSFNHYLNFRSVATSDSNYYFSGEVIPHGWLNEDYDLKTFCFDKQFNQKWAKQIVIPNRDDFGIQCIFQNNKLHLLGISDEDLPSNRFIFSQYDTLGNLLNQKTYYDSNYRYIKAYSFLIDKDSNYIICGNRRKLNPPDFRPFILKLDKNLDTIFSQNITTGAANGFNNLIPINDSEYISIGYTMLNTQQSFPLMLKIKIQNTYLNLQTLYSDTINTFISKIFKSDYDSSILASYNSVNLLKFDFTGKLIWNSNLSNIINNYFYITKVFQVTDKGYLLFGSEVITSNTGNTSKIVIYKLDSLGNFEFATSINPFSKNSINISIYPNPTNDILNINSEITYNNLSIIDMSGKILKSYPSYTKQISLQEIPYGYYFLKATFKDGYKIIKFNKK